MEKLLVFFLYLISMLWIIMGTLLVFVPELIKNKICKPFLKDLKKKGVLPFILGVLLLLSASYNRYTLLIVILGILGIIKGMMILLATEKMEKMANWWLKAGNNICRISGVAIIILGSIMLMGI